MTQDQIKTSIDKAFDAELDRLFGFFTTNLETQTEGQATKEFRKGFESALRAHAIATELAVELIKG